MLYDKFFSIVGLYHVHSMMNNGRCGDCCELSPTHPAMLTAGKVLCLLSADHCFILEHNRHITDVVSPL